MTLGIVGLGLIGGSFARAASEKTEHRVIGTSRRDETVSAALECGAISGRLTDGNICECDIVIVALYPDATIEYVGRNISKMKRNAILIDACGIKGKVCSACGALARLHGIRFIGGHPMAGLEHSGFEYSSAHLFEGASMIVCPDESADKNAVDIITELSLALGFSRVTHSTPSEHDDIIAFTSQLAHVVSSAYVQSEMSDKHAGFSAGSYKDLTRVARLNSEMWCELFFENKQPLISQIDGLIERLCKYSRALKEDDKAAMTNLLLNGTKMKIISDGLD